MAIGTSSSELNNRALIDLGVSIVGEGAESGAESVGSFLNPFVLTMCGARCSLVMKAIENR